MPSRNALLVCGGHVLTCDPAVGAVDADVLIDNDVITEIRPHIVAPDGARIVDARDAIVIPGFVDTHRHMWQGTLRGLGADHSLRDYLKHVLGTLADRHSPTDVYLGQLISAYAALDAGITCVQDFANIHDTPQHSDAAVDALQTAGVRAVLAYGHSRPLPHAGGAVPGAVAADAARVRGRLGDDRALVTMALDVDAFTDEAIAANWRLAADLDVAVALHVVDGLGGEPLIRRLHRLGVLALRGQGATYVHATDVAAEDLARIRDTGGSVSVAAAIELLMGHGLPPMLDALDAGLAPSLSTDTEVMVPADMFTQMRTALAIARHTASARARVHGREHPRLVPAADALRWATVNGAAALGMADRIGSLAVGKQADLVVISTGRPGMRPLHDPAASVVLAADRADIDTVIVAGTVVKEHGRLLNADLPSLYEKVDRLRSRLAAVR
ncbi:amidohydrolase family protein [Nocardia terpenica]|uniref:amidohydrolase family protein n=1 Tax=Nocardia terpenica TaxID=455432 RepID=UPI00142DB30A|nr:amidohydrolase family protein [Nocardia terpenica]